MCCTLSSHLFFLDEVEQSLIPSPIGPHLAGFPAGCAHVHFRVVVGEAIDKGLKSGLAG